MTTISRTAIYYGADHEYSFALSDYYINLLETKQSLTELVELYYEMIGMYRELIQTRSFTNYSVPVQTAMKFIQANLYAPLTVADVAKSAHLVPSHFSRVFGEEVGLSPSDYIEQQKMKEAARMLEAQEGNVLEIAEALGYCSSSHFIQRFKKIYGVTPGKYKPAN